MRQGGRIGLRRGLMALVITALALSAFAIAPASAQSSGSWTLDCKGDASGGVSWNWLLNGVPIPGASGFASCSGMMTVTGSSARPANANGFAATLTVSIGSVLSLGYKSDTKSVNKTFDAGASFKVRLSASVSGYVQSCNIRCFWAHEHGGAQFSLEG